MPVRIFRHYLHLPILLLALAEGAAFFGAPYVAAYLLFEHDFWLRYVNAEEMWLKALMFAAAMSIGMMAMGLYSAQQRARILGVLLRIMAAALAGAAVAGLLFYLVPEKLHLGRGLWAYSIVVAVAAAMVVRVLFSHLVGEDIFKRRPELRSRAEAERLLAEADENDAIGRMMVGQWARLEVPLSSVYNLRRVASLLHGLAVRDALSPEALAGLGAEDWAGLLRFAARAAAITCSRAGAEPPYAAELA